MRFLVCAVYDAAVRAYNAPLVFRSKPEAIRSFSDAVQDESKGFAKHANDYSLMQLGWYDDSTGVLDRLTGPERLLAASEVLFDDVFPPSTKVG